MRQHLYALVVCGAAVGATGCDESLSKVAGPTPNLEPTFRSIQQDIFDPENSYLVHKVEGRPGIVGGRMPFSGPYLSDGQILILKRWIANGAPNN